MYFYPYIFCRYLHCQTSYIVWELWYDMHLISVSEHLAQPVLKLVGGVVSGIDSSAKSESGTLVVAQAAVAGAGGRKGK